MLSPDQEAEGLKDVVAQEVTQPVVSAVDAIFILTQEGVLAVGV